MEAGRRWVNNKQFPSLFHLEHLSFEAFLDHIVLATEGPEEMRLASEWDPHEKDGDAKPGPNMQSSSNAQVT